MEPNRFKEYPTLDLNKIADEILDFWDKESIFQKSIETRRESEPFIFFEGPPSANGMPGIHHVMARAIKDIFCRYKTQKGYLVNRKAGWDTHGLPVELGVEKELGITKEDIGSKISVADYNQACKKAVMRYTDVWNTLTEKIGYWVDMEAPYITYKPKYMESVWWLLAQIYKKGWLYKGYTIQPYSPKAGTGLSSHELNQPGTYQQVTDTTVIAQFKAIKHTLPQPLQNIEGTIYFLAWTTTPWTLPSNTALTVGAQISYSIVQTYNQYTFAPIVVILAENCITKQLSKPYFETTDVAILKAYQNKDKKIPFQIIARCTGKDLVDARYEQLLEYAKPYHNPENAFRVIPGDFVTTEDGTGIVHTAPTFGADDALVAKKAIPEVPAMLVQNEVNQLVPLVDLQGKFTTHMKELSGKYVKNDYYPKGESPEKSVDVELAIKLKIENKAFKVEKYAHSYPNCWRTDKPILYYPLDSWFIKVTAFKDRMHTLNQQINWKPKATGEKRFGNWLANANDWNLSRSRFWGIPLPIWRTKDSKEERCIESISQLQSEIEKAIAAGLMKDNPFSDFRPGDNSEANYDTIDLHKNIVDQVVLVSDSGKAMYRESDLIDVWFDSGSMPYAQWHFPFENQEKVLQQNRTADFIAEGVDQTRGWFYTLHAIATAIFDDVAYKNVVSNGLVLDKSGQKMSKRLGNAVDPFRTLEQFGPDATRWYMISNANPWDNLKFDSDGIVEVQRKFFGTLYNTYAFFVLYANIDGFTYAEEAISLEKRTEIDRWILSELHTLIQEVDAMYLDYDPTRAARAISEFVQENLSNWFVRLSRRRYWKGEYQQDKIAAYQTLYECLLTVSKLAAPIAPFFMDRLYQDLNSITKKEDHISVHLSKFPSSDSSWIDKKLESKMQKAQTISSLVLSLRQKQRIKVRQPLQRIMIPVLNETEREELLEIADLIQSEVNVKEMELIDENSGILVKQVKPNFKNLGPRFGKDMKLIVNEIRNFDQNKIKTLEQTGEFCLNINGKMIKLDRDDVLISSQDIEGWLVANTDRFTVALDVSITPDLQKEGIARELVNRIQNLRKDRGFAVTDRIAVVFENHKEVEEAVSQNQEYIKTETLSDTIRFVDEVLLGTEFAFDTIAIKIQILKL